MNRHDLALETCKIVTKKHSRPITVALFMRHYKSRYNVELISFHTAYNLINELHKRGDLIRVARGAYVLK